MEVASVDFRFKCAIRVSRWFLYFGLAVKDRHALLLFFAEKDFLALGVDKRPESILSLKLFLLLFGLTLDVPLLVFHPGQHLVVVFLRRTDCFSFVFLFKLVHIYIKLFLILFVLLE